MVELIATVAIIVVKHLNEKAFARVIITIDRSLDDAKILGAKSLASFQ